MHRAIMPAHAMYFFSHQKSHVSVVMVPFPPFERGHKPLACLFTNVLYKKQFLTLHVFIIGRKDAAAMHSDDHEGCTGNARV